MSSAVHAVEILRVGPEAKTSGRDVAATEEPLEIRLGGTTFVVIMRTPGADRELAAGFLLSERVLDNAAEIASIRHCLDDGSQEIHNVLNVWLTGAAAERAADRLAERRHVTVNSSCGVCGRRSIDDLMTGIRPIASSMTMSRAVIAELPQRMRAAQQVFDATGGLHAAGLFARDGQLIAAAEDVGRHNAVDKVLGAALLAGRLPLPHEVLFVSGRTSFEIVQKAVVAGVPIVASVSAPSSLAIELARDAQVTLLGFVRGDSFNVYSCAERIAL